MREWEQEMQLKAEIAAATEGLDTERCVRLAPTRGSDDPPPVHAHSGSAPPSPAQQLSQARRDSARRARRRASESLRQEIAEHSAEHAAALLNAEASAR
eukprot:COSAG01_NODE_3593_length_5898_cov_5.089310_6_plen_99_part_00